MRAIDWDLAERGVAELQYLTHPRTQRHLTAPERQRYMRLYATLYDIAHLILTDDDDSGDGLSLWDFTPRKWGAALRRWQKGKSAPRNRRR